jgi:hypothetical protein
LVDLVALMDSWAIIPGQQHFSSPSTCSSIQVGIARLPLSQELSDFDLSDTPINQNLVRDLATGAFNQQAWALGLESCVDLLSAPSRRD